MAVTFYNRVKASVIYAPHTGAVPTGSAVAPYGSFTDAGVVDGATVSYLIEDGINYEYGHGTYRQSSKSLERTTILGSNNGNQAIDASANAIVSLTVLAEDLTALQQAAAYNGSSGSTGSTSQVKARYWRVDNLIPQGGTGFVGCGELQFFDASGNQIPSSSPFSNGADTDPIQHVNDGDLTTFWTTNHIDGTGFVGLDLGANAQPSFLLLSPRNGGLGYSIRIFNISYSIDQINWTTIKSNVTAANWDRDNQTQNFSIQ